MSKQLLEKEMVDENCHGECKGCDLVWDVTEDIGPKDIVELAKAHAVQSGHHVQVVVSKTLVYSWTGPVGV